VATATYYALGEGDDGEMIIKPKDAFYDDGFVSASIYVVHSRPTAVKEAPFPVYWMGGDLDIKCQEHQWHMVFSSLGNLERTQFSTIPNARFSPWAPIVPGSSVQKAEALVCRNSLASGVTPVEDLTAYGRQRVARAAAPNQAVAAPPASPRRAAITGGSARPHNYQMVEANNEGAVFVDVSTASRQADLASVTQFNLLAKPQKAAGVSYSWVEATAEFDCKAHRFHNRIEAMLTLGRTRRQAYPQPKFGPWTPITNKSLGSTIEGFACSQEPWTGQPLTNLDEMAGDVLHAIQVGFFKDQTTPKR
jgi:hypothetical protein